LTIPPVREGNTVSRDAVCQEASLFSRGRYIPCGAPATHVIRHDQEQRAYYMCDACADHNIRNRGGKDVTARVTTP
jgi:hypothetical protein